jgi:hypothetical protein
MFTGKLVFSQAPFVSQALIPPTTIRNICATSFSMTKQRTKRLSLFTNNFELPALLIGQLYKCRWRVELFSKMD